VETYLGILIGAVTFTGSVAAFGKLTGRISSKPLLLPARHWLNLGLLILAIWFGHLFLQGENLFPIIVGWPEGIVP
jgi:H+-translocating NAD(P) transhydrogenase subunit beta